MVKKEPILSFVIPVPLVGFGKHKTNLCTNNNIHIWYRYYKTKIKNQLRDTLSNWMVPKSDLKAKSGNIHFTLLRPNARRLDADSITLTGKMITDFIVDQGWLMDDDNLHFHYHPVVIERDRVETEIRVELFTD